MARDVQEPTVTHEKWAGIGTREVLRHPAFAQVAIRHVQGTANLYGSDFEHHNFVTLTISTSEVHRDLNRDWHFERGELITIALSEAQYATMISAPNRQGVPCTLESREGRMVPGLPRRDSTKLYAEELSGKLRDTVDALKAQRDDIKAAVSKLPKKVQEQILGPIEKAIREIASNAPFVVKSFGEHMEATIEKAKIEVNAYATNTVMRAGIATLNGQPVLALTDETEPDNTERPGWGAAL